jgi:hypothetical protein
LSGALVLRGRHQIVSSPISRRSLLRRLRLTFRPWSRSSTFEVQLIFGPFFF